MRDPEGTEAAAGGAAERRPSRGRRSGRPPTDTGRRHHIGDAPQVLPFFRPDGTVGTTRTAQVQLRDKSVPGLELLAAQLDAEMATAAGRLDFETAAHLRDEAAAVRAELGRRVGGGAPDG